MAEEKTSGNGKLIGGVLVVAALAVGAYFLFGAKKDVVLVVNTAPSGATVHLVDPSGPSDQTANGKEGARFEGMARTGAYKLTVDLAGYKQKLIEGTFPDKEGEHRVSVSLDPLGASIAVVTEPPGATVYIDNRSHGKAPVTIPDIEPGSVTLSARLKGYAPVNRVVELKPGQDEKLLLTLKENQGAETAIVDETIEPGYGRVIVTSNLPARILVNNHIMAGAIVQTSFQVAEGRHRITATAEKIETQHKMVDITEGSVIQVSFDFDPERPLKKAMEAIDPETPLYWVIRGGNARNEGKYGDAVDMFKKALEIDPNDWSAHRQLSRTFPAMKQWDEAIEHSEEYLKLYPEAPDAKFTREMLGLYKQAKAAQENNEEFKPRFKGVGFRPDD